MDLQNTVPTPDESGIGYLIVRVTTARGAIPIEGARVNIRNQRSEFSEERGDVVASTQTARDGTTGVIPLTAPPKSNSLSPNAAEPPYTSYWIEARQNGYYDQTFLGVPIFDGITAIQTVDLIPVSENETSDGFSQHGEVFTETKAPDL